MKLNRNIALTIVCIILGLIVALQFKSTYYNQQVAAYAKQSVDELMNDIYNKDKEIKDLSTRNSELEKRNKEYEDGRNVEESLKKELDRARMIAGLVDVKGQGVIIKIDNSEFGEVQEDNILDVLNELRASNAQAISVNNERIIATSEVRTAGRYIMVNGSQLQAPFEIKVIANADTMEHTLKMIGGVEERLKNQYFLNVTIEKSDNVTILKVRDDGTVIRTDMMTVVK
jgi:uncharacterized protein YlxW (UPF0749 family)